jgi:hypothetical protein
MTDSPWARWSHQLLLRADARLVVAVDPAGLSPALLEQCEAEGLGLVHLQMQAQAAAASPELQAAMHESNVLRAWKFDKPAPPSPKVATGGGVICTRPCIFHS